MFLYKMERSLVEVSLDAPVFDAINSKLKYETGTLNLHPQLKIQIVELYPFSCGQSRE
jgi:hypothetical protein